MSSRAAVAFASAPKPRAPTGHGKARIARAAETTVILMLVLVLAAPEAQALHEPFDFAAAPALLPGGASLGTATGVRGTVHERDGSSPCDSESSSHPYAAIYRTRASKRSLLELSVRTASEAPHLCEVALYRARAGDSSFTDPFDATQRATFLVSRTRACATSTRCGIERWLAGGTTYYVVMWATDPGKDEPDPSFTYGARVRAPVVPALSVTGHRIVDGRYHEVIRRRRYTITVRVPGATGAVRFRYYKRRWVGGATGWQWYLADVWNRTLSSGTASIHRTAYSGKRRFVVHYLGSDARLPALSAPLSVKHVRVRWRRYADGGAKLRVPWYHQRYRLSCEAASLRMALRFYGIRKTDRQILRRIGIDDRPRRGNRWGDPNEAFVGSYNGYMGSTGYGVHARPVKKAAGSYRPGRPALRLRDASYASIAGHLNNGFPVIMWGAHSGPSGVRRMTWYSWEGRYVRAWSVEHTWTVIGFRGPASDPTHFIVHNPSGSAAKKLTIRQFRRFVRYFNRSGVVVR